jgi:hypothetical protein
MEISSRSYSPFLHIAYVHTPSAFGEVLRGSLPNVKEYLDQRHELDHVEMFLVVDKVFNDYL